MDDVRNFHHVGLHSVYDDERQWWQGKLARAFNSPLSSSIRKELQRSRALVNASRDFLCGVRILMMNALYDTRKIFSSGR